VRNNLRKEGKRDARSKEAEKPETTGRSKEDEVRIQIQKKQMLARKLRLWPVKLMHSKFFRREGIKSTVKRMCVSERERESVCVCVCV
jgi:hypothetical protein